MTKKDEAESLKPAAGFSPTEFLQETKQELDKVVWPDRQQLIGESVSVLLMVVLSAGVISLVDKLFRWLAGQVF